VIFVVPVPALTVWEVLRKEMPKTTVICPLPETLVFATEVAVIVGVCVPVTVLGAL
jgi:hypothetical protein